MYPPLSQQLLGLNPLYRERVGMKSKVRSEPGSVNGVTQCGHRSEEGDAVTRGRVPQSPPPGAGGSPESKPFREADILLRKE